MKPNRFLILNFFIFFIFYSPYILFAETVPSFPTTTFKDKFFKGEFIEGNKAEKKKIFTMKGMKDMKEKKRF